MSRVAYSRKGSLIFYIDDIEIGSYGYAIDYTKGDSSRGVSCQCKIKVVEYMVFGTETKSKKYFMNLSLKYPSKLYKRFVLHYVGRTIVVCVKQISGWETDLLKQEEITHMILFGETKFKKDEDMITFNRYWERGISK